MTNEKNKLLREALLKAFAKDCSPPPQAMVALMEQLATALRDRERPSVNPVLKH